MPAMRNEIPGTSSGMEYEVRRHRNMSMITELVDRLKKYARFSRATNPSWSEAMQEAATTISDISAKLQAAMMERSSQYYHGGWIPCDDRLPEEDTPVIAQWQVRDEVYIDILTYDCARHEWRAWKGCGSPSRKVDAWCPIPKAYRPEKEGESDDREKGYVQ